MTWPDPPQIPPTGPREVRDRQERWAREMRAHGYLVIGPDAADEMAGYLPRGMCPDVDAPRGVEQRDGTERGEGAPTYDDQARAWDAATGAARHTFTPGDKWAHGPVGEGLCNCGRPEGHTDESSSVPTDITAEQWRHTFGGLYDCCPAAPTQPHTADCPRGTTP